MLQISYDLILPL